MLVGATSRDRLHDLVAASAAATTSAAGGEVRLDVAVALCSFVPAGIMASLHSQRVADAIWGALAIVAPLEVLGLAPMLGTWHPLRVGIPLVMGTVALYEAHAQHASRGAVPRGYVMALLTFALAGVGAAALFFHALGGAWIVPGFTILVCAMICIVALIPKGRVKWLLS